jgi:hypothetical protein
LKVLAVDFLGKEGKFAFHDRYPFFYTGRIVLMYKEYNLPGFKTGFKKAKNQPFGG